MKVAVLGSGPLAIEIATDLSREGATVKLIGKNSPGGHCFFLSQSFPSISLEVSRVTTAIGREVSGLDLKGLISAQELFERYYVPLIEALASQRCIQVREVLRVQKQFLDVEEQIDSHSRLFDLFRVTTGLNPSGMVEEQLAANPELREKIGEDILSSLKSRVESFEDFDLVIDARGNFQQSKKLGPAGYFALNEFALSENSQIQYGFLQPSVLKELESEKTISIVGSGYNAAVNLCMLEPWLEKEESRVINIVTSETAAFKSFLKDDSSPELLKEGVRRIIKTHLSLWRKQCEKVEEQILHWRGLEAHERMKITPPEFPTPKVCLYEGYSVTSVDRLLDQDATFLTLEIPRWRNENDTKELVTLAQDLVLGSAGFSEENEVLGPMQSDEPGFFKLRAGQDLESGLDKIKLIKSVIFSYFSKADSGPV